MRAAALLVLFILPFALAALEVRKVAEGGPQRYIIKLGYRWNGTDKGSDFAVEDRLPITVELQGGQLVQKLPDATSQWKEIEYVVGASDELVFTLANQSYEILLPSARFSYKAAGKTERKTVETSTLTITLSHPSITGTWNASWLVFLVVWVLPIVAAVLGLRSLSRSSAPPPSTPTPKTTQTQKPKKN